jgi:hypothetical protein
MTEGDGEDIRRRLEALKAAAAAEQAEELRFEQERVAANAPLRNRLTDLTTLAKQIASSVPEAAEWFEVAIEGDDPPHLNVTFTWSGEATDGYIRRRTFHRLVVASDRRRVSDGEILSASISDVEFSNRVKDVFAQWLHEAQPNLARQQGLRAQQLKQMQQNRLGCWLGIVLVFALVLVGLAQCH